MKTLYTVLIYFMNLGHFRNKYELGKLDDSYYIYTRVNHQCLIACISIKQIIFLYIPIVKLADAFYTYTEEEQRFVLYHELAHFKLKHHLVFVVPYDTKTRDRFEFEADDYAASKVGREIALKALNRTRNILIRLEYNIIQINERIESMELNDDCIYL